MWKKEQKLVKMDMNMRAYPKPKIFLFLSLFSSSSFFNHAVEFSRC